MSAADTQPPLGKRSQLCADVKASSRSPSWVGPRGPGEPQNEVSSQPLAGRHAVSPFSSLLSFLPVSWPWGHFRDCLERGLLGNHLRVAAEVQAGSLKGELLCPAPASEAHTHTCTLAPPQNSCTRADGQSSLGSLSCSRCSGLLVQSPKPSASSSSWASKSFSLMLKGEFRTGRLLPPLPGSHTHLRTPALPLGSKCGKLSATVLALGCVSCDK